MLFLLLFSSLLSVALYYLFPVFTVRKPRIHVKKGSSLHSRSKKHLSFLKEPYRPPWWAHNGTVNTVARLFQSGPRLPWCREIVTFPDGGTAALDWLHPPGGRKDSTLLVLFPGITGHTDKAYYMWNAAKEAVERGWRVLVINRRGLGVPLKTARIAGPDNSDDVAFILDNFVLPQYSKAKKIGCGFSMGGMILFNFLASRRKEKAVFDFAMSVCSVFDPHASDRMMSHTFPLNFINHPVAKELVETIAPYREILKDEIDFDYACGSKTIGEFKDRCTAPLNGYDDLNYYYLDIGLYTKVDKMTIPFLVLTAEDDYFCPPLWMPWEAFDKSENVLCVVTSHGGHIGYMETSDVNSRSYVERVLFEWAEMHLEAKQ